MAKLGGTKFTWVIKNFSSLQSKTPYSSDIHEIGTSGDNCFIGAVRSGVSLEDLTVKITYGLALPIEQTRYVKYRLIIVNQLSGELSIIREGMHCFYPSTMVHSFTTVFLFSKFHDKDGGFLVNDEVTTVVGVGVLDDVPVTKPLTSTIMGSINVNGFQVFPSQVDSLKRIFEKHPDIADEFHAKNQHLRSACMSSLLGLIETLCQSLQELSNEDLVEAGIALKYVKDAGFKVDWLEKNLDQMKAKKMKELSDLATLQETEEKVLSLKRKFEELDALAEEQKKKLSAIRTPLSFDDLV
ncbi:unnamed protein product [Eruca vesicaria subsp. sativa]|uniref:MATH domain-containing protein n=1 Tax=Eruca vesicaria subsp. sativa TaxID=29727 RepID=A0ABC8JW08_ERUVS|nr:unnamed protein product [Eruca vesicaria subsp. sativa]